jgi:hypothetical protein
MAVRIKNYLVYDLCSSRIQKEHVSETDSAAIRRGKAGEGPNEVSPTDRAVLNRWSTHVS